MILLATVVFVILPAIGLGAERGERCTNQWGEKATCTTIYSCKAAMDALAVANGTKLYAAGIVCGYDSEPLVCCRTVADFDETPNNNIVPPEGDTVGDATTAATSITEPLSSTNTSTDLNISTNTSAFNESVQVVLELSINNDTQISTGTTIASDDVRISSNNKQTTSSTTSSDEVIFTSPPIVLTTAKTVPSVIPSASDTTTKLISSTTARPSAVPDALPLQSNGTSNSPAVPDLSRFPDQSSSSAFPDSTSNIIPAIPQSSALDGPITPQTLGISTEQSAAQDITTVIYINDVLPDRNTCGFQNKRNRLADAAIATIDEFPWVALLRYQDMFGNDVGFKCVGTLITDRYVITSHHCVVTDPEFFELKSVRLGEWSISSPHDCVFDYKGQECPDKLVDVGVEKAIPFPTYDPIRANNIALIRMERNVKFTDFVRPICLPVDDLQAPSAGTILTTSGWGATTTGCLLDIKSKIHLPAVSKEKCSNNPFWPIPVSEVQVCVAGTSKNDICETDSGGPLMMLHGRHKPQWYLEGVISEGFYCDYRGSHGVYSRVSKYIPWIIFVLEQ